MDNTAPVSSEMFGEEGTEGLCSGLCSSAGLLEELGREGLEVDSSPDSSPDSTRDTGDSGGAESCARKDSGPL